MRPLNWWTPPWKVWTPNATPDQKRIVARLWHRVRSRSPMPASMPGIAERPQGACSVWPIAGVIEIQLPLTILRSFLPVLSPAPFRCFGNPLSACRTEATPTVVPGIAAAAGGAWLMALSCARSAPQRVGCCGRRPDGKTVTKVTLRTAQVKVVSEL